MMCDQEKFNCLMPYTFAKLSDVDYLVCDAAVPETFARAAKTEGLYIL